MKRLLAALALTLSCSTLRADPDGPGAWYTAAVTIDVRQATWFVASETAVLRDDLIQHPLCDFQWYWPGVPQGEILCYFVYPDGPGRFVFLLASRYPMQRTIHWVYSWEARRPMRITSVERYNQ